MKNILVTGGNGQLGSEFKFLAKDHDDLQFTFIDIDDADLTSSIEVKAYFLKNHFDIIINCAAYTAVDNAEDNQEIVFKANRDVPSTLAKVAKAQDAILFHISTDFVFDGKSKRPYLETDTANPVSVYGQSKLEGEEKIIKNYSNHFIFRTSWLYSSYGNNFVKTMLRLSKEKDDISVVSDQIGSPTYARDLANVILLAITSGSNKFGVYNYSNDGVISWHEFAKVIFELNSIDIVTNVIQSNNYYSKAERPMYSVLDKTKVKKNFNVAVPNWKESLRLCLIELEK